MNPNIICLSLPFKSPEILSRRRYGAAVDMWAVGCIAYELKRGRCKTPFDNLNPVSLNRGGPRVLILVFDNKFICL